MAESGLSKGQSLPKASGAFPPAQALPGRGQRSACASGHGRGTETFKLAQKAPDLAVSD